jgi:predicted acetyltransferase
MAVTIEAAGLDRQTTLANLMQLYIHDFSELWAGTPDGELQEDGTFGPYPELDAYGMEPQRAAWLIRVDTSLAGFALVNTATHSGRPADWNMAEFFVARKHRRGGAGTAAAQAIFTSLPGLWEVAVARRNIGALAFWRRAITAAAGVGNVEETDHTTAVWNGPIIRFSLKEALP